MWRRQFINSIPTISSHSETQEGRNMDYLNNYVRLIRRKEDVFFRLCDLDKRNSQQIDVQIQVNLLRKEIDKIKMEEVALIDYLKEEASEGKTYMYGLLSRIFQILEVTKQRLRLLDAKYASMLELQKKAIYDFYSQQVYAGNYNLSQMIQFTTSTSGNRIAFLVRPLFKVLAANNEPTIPLRPSVLQQTGTQMLSSFKKKSMSEMFLKTTTIKTVNLLEMVSKKSREAMTPLQKPHRSKSKNTASRKPKPKKIYERLYGIMDVRNIFLDPLYEQCSDKHQFEEKLLQNTKKRNEIAFKSVEEFQQRSSQFQKKKQEKSYKIRTRKARNEDDWIPMDLDGLAKE